MSRHEFMFALTLYAKDIPFRSLIMAAILTGEEEMKETLRESFPDIWEEVRERSAARDGRIRGDENKGGT